MRKFFLLLFIKRLSISLSFCFRVYTSSLAGKCIEVEEVNSMIGVIGVMLPLCLRLRHSLFPSASHDVDVPREIALSADVLDVGCVELLNIDRHSQTL